MKGGAKSIAFLVKKGRRERLNRGEEFPTEFFYGYPQLLKAGLDVSILEDSVLDLHQQGFIWRIISRLCVGLFGIHPFAIRQLSRKKSQQQLGQFDTIVVTTTTFGFALAFLKYCGRLPMSVVFVLMGAADKNLNFIARKIRYRLLKETIPLAISKGELELLSETKDLSRTVQYLVFGVDHEFWTPEEAGAKADSGRPYVFSIGNDLNRDYQTLLKSWKPHYPELRIVTNHTIQSGADNVTHIAGEWGKELLTDSEIRDLYRNALFVVLPIRETIQPSGQSACLQAMACGKAVILSDIQGIWDRDAMVDSGACILVPPGSPEMLSKEAEAIMEDETRLQNMGIRARKIVETRFNTEKMVSGLNDILRNID